MKTALAVFRNQVYYLEGNADKFLPLKMYEQHIQQLPASPIFLLDANSMAAMSVLKLLYRKFNKEFKVITKFSCPSNAEHILDLILKADEVYADKPFLFAFSGLTGNNLSYNSALNIIKIEKILLGRFSIAEDLQNYQAYAKSVVGIKKPSQPIFLNNDYYFTEDLGLITKSYEEIKNYLKYKGV